MKMSQMQFKIEPDCMRMPLRFRWCGQMEWTITCHCIFHLWDNAYNDLLMDSKISLRCFSNSYEKVVYVDNAHMIGISIYYGGFRIGYGKLMHFNDLHVFLWLTGVYVFKKPHKCIACAYE